MIKAIACQIAENIRIEEVKALFSDQILFADEDEVFLSSGGDTYYYLFKHGIIAFFGFDQRTMHDIIETAIPACVKYSGEHYLSEELRIYSTPHDISIGYNEIGIPLLDPETIRIILFNVAQSVALRSCSIKSLQLLDDTKQHTIQLEKLGYIRIRGSSLKKYIGKILNIKNSIVQDIYIFESHALTWENEYLNKIDQALKKIFEISTRYRSLTEDLQIIKENLELFKDLMQHRHSSFLEWIVIILIFIEVVDMIISRIF